MEEDADGRLNERIQIETAAFQVSEPKYRC